MIDDDCDIRTEFSNVTLTWMNERPHFLNNMLWSDHDNVSGFVKRHYCYYWSEEKPSTSLSIERMQTRPKLTVRCGFTANRFLGLFTVQYS